MEAAVGVWLASLLGSLHCGAMCGPFVAFYTGSAGPHRQPLAGSGARAGVGFAPHIAYSLGRLAAYLTLGMIAGTLGAGVDRIGALGGMTRAAAVVAGGIMVAWGASTILAWRGVRVRWLHAPPAVGAPMRAAVARVRYWPPLLRAGATGLATALLPCGWLYAFVAVAGGTGSPVRGALTMALFWTGTLPVMLAIGLGLQRLFGTWRTRLPVVTASVVVVLGLLTIAGRLRGPERAEAGTPHAAHQGMR